jgi:hypothetical protein
MGAGGHLDADAIDLEELEKQSQALDQEVVPEGAIRCLRAGACAGLELLVYNSVPCYKLMLTPGGGLREQTTYAYVNLGFLLL